MSHKDLYTNVNSSFIHRNPEVETVHDCPSTDECTNKSTSSHKKRYYSAMEKYNYECMKHG
jgi:hypothetical protein